MVRIVTENKKFIAFYSGFNYWAGQKTKLPKTNVDKFKEIIYEPVYSYENEFYTLCFSHLGLTLLHIVDQETDEDVVLKDNEEIWELERELQKYKNERNEKGVELLLIKANDLLQKKEKSHKTIESEVAKWEKYLYYVNSLYFILTSARKSLTNVAGWSTRPKGILDITRLIIRDGKINLYTQENTSDINRMFQNYKSSGTLLSPEYWEVVPKTTFDEINSNFAKVISTPRLSERLAQLLKASNEYENHNFSYAILLAWLIIESVITNKWEAYIDNSSITSSEKNRISPERKKTLTGRDYPISVMLNFLELSNKISLERYLIIDKIRKIRNKIVHGESNFLCSENDCRCALNLALELATEGTSLHLEWHFGLMVPHLM
jgi:hypothetical protein